MGVFPGETIQQDRQNPADAHRCIPEVSRKVSKPWRAPDRCKASFQEPAPRCAIGCERDTTRANPGQWIL